METHANKWSKKGKVHDQSPRRNKKFRRKSRPKREFESFECFTCHKMGHIAINFPLKEKQLKKRNKKFHAHVVKYDDLVEENNNEDEDSTEEYVLILSLTRSISHGSDTWLIDNGASRHMIGYKDSLNCLVKKRITSQSKSWK